MVLMGSRSYFLAVGDTCRSDQKTNHEKHEKAGKHGKERKVDWHGGIFLG